MSIIAKNVRSPWGEVDIVALDQDAVVFVEVKAWSAYGIENLQYGLNLKKQRRIIETAKYFLSEHREYNGKAVRFDVVFVKKEAAPGRKPGVPGRESGVPGKRSGVPGKEPAALGEFTVTHLASAFMERV
jgi:uncharacterized protein (TIGR00252 family)